MAHNVVKAEKLTLTALGMLEQELRIPATFQREGIDQYRGAKDDTISVTVEGVLPFRSYGWRNNRAQPIVFDEYAERKVSLTFGGDVYSAVKLTDEQVKMDIDGWAKLLRPQSKAIARGLSRGAVSTLTGQDYEVSIKDAEGNIRGAILEARRVLNKFQVPGEQRWLVVGSDFESVMLQDEKLVLAANVGDDIAASTLREATLGRHAGFNVVSDQTIPGDHAYAYVPSAFVMANAAPAVPESVPFGSSLSFEGYALRWLRDYDSAYMQDRSVVNCYKGFRAVEDVLVGWNGSNQEIISDAEYFVRGVKLELGGAAAAGDYPADGDELATITGITNAKVWTPTGPIDLS